MAGTTLSDDRAGYHSFLVRVFLDGPSHVDHGNVTHIASRSRESFSDLDEAPRLMRRLLDDSPDGAPAAVGTNPAAASGALVARISTADVVAPGMSPPRAPSSIPWGLPAAPAASKRIQRRVKRVMDVCGAAVALLVFSFVMAAIAVAIRLDSPGPVFYRQRRAAAGGRIFTMYKFRSMRVDADDLLPALLARNEQSSPIFKLSNDPRRTRVGGILRRFSLDELPQLFNVLRGDLSLVGPRPPLASELAAYAPAHWPRLAVPQGMTGLWQVSGRSLLNFDAMLSLDIRYIRSWSLMSDVRILLRTVPAVLSGRGAF